MAIIAEWQARLDGDFPKGAQFWRDSWKDQWGYPDARFTTSLTVWRILPTTFPQLLFWEYQGEKDFLVTIQSYQVTDQDPLRATITTPEGDKWFLSSYLPSKVTDENWMAQRTIDRGMAQRGGV